MFLSILWSILYIDTLQKSLYPIRVDPLTLYLSQGGEVKGEGKKEGENDGKE
jgi:hypothetical protein